jgi:hypothetical protein
VRRSGKQARKPLRSGALIVSEDFRLSGPAKGFGKRRTKKQREALDAGRRTSKRERAAMREMGGGLGALEVFRAYDAAAEGDFSALSRLSVRRQARASKLHDEAVAVVEREGLVIDETAMDGSGNVIATRKRIHPAADFAMKSAETFGLTADAMLLTPKARGGAKRDDALTRMLERQAQLRASLSLNPPAVDAEIVEDGEAE